MLVECVGDVLPGNEVFDIFGLHLLDDFDRVVDDGIERT
jgi:hypothetical protein